MSNIELHTYHRVHVASVTSYEAAHAVTMLMDEPLVVEGASPPLVFVPLSRLPYTVGPVWCFEGGGPGEVSSPGRGTK